jgi:rhodanese-related sulfurtransferase
MNSITVQQLQAWRDEGVDHQLIDIREPYEYDVSHIGGEHIPMGDIKSRIDDIRTDVPVVIHCRSGSRSAAVTHALTEQLGFDNVHNLEGGIRAWAEHLDPNMDVA